MTAGEFPHLGDGKDGAGGDGAGRESVAETVTSPFRALLDSLWNRIVRTAHWALFAALPVRIAQRGPCPIR